MRQITRGAETRVSLRYRQRLYLDRTHKLHRGNRSIERVYRRLYDRVAWEERHFDKNRKAIGHDFFRNPEQGFADAESFRKFPYPFEPRQYPIIGSFPEEDMIEEARDRLEHAEIDAAKDLQVSPSKMKRIKAAGTILRYMEKQKNMGGSRHPRK